MVLVGELSEPALVRDEAAFEALIRPLMEPGFRIAYSMLGDRSEAEDAVQEAVLRAWRKLGQLSSRDLARPWFFAIVANQCRNLRRTRWFRVVRVADIWGGQGWSDPAERIDLGRALARLPMSDRLALFLRYYLDLPLAEVAQVLGVTPGAAKVRIHRLCARLRPELREEDL